MTAANATSETKWYRGDITGLRTVAIIPVVAFHAGFSLIPGGFTGVDIFYAISGFLITTMLLREFSSTGTVSVSRFWAKRVRRLVPALSLMVLVTLPVAVVLGSPYNWEELGVSAASALLYVSNFLFAITATDYFADGGTPNPFLHTWSLGVEEQFYLFWPFLVLLGGLVAMRLRLSSLTTVRVVLGTVLVASLVISITQTASSPVAAFYLLPARAWEFALPGLIATLPIDRFVTSTLRSNLLSTAGLILIFASLLFITDSDPFPGWLALFPVCGAILVMVGGTTSIAAKQGVVSRLIASSPMRWIGNVSYSWYLWHWPVIVLAVVVFGSSLTVTTLAAIASLLIGWATYKFVENPLRFSTRLRSSLKRTFVGALVITLGVGFIAGATYVAGYLSTSSPALSSTTSVKEWKFTPTCVRVTSLPDGQSVCEMGAVDSERTVLLVGDSHAAQWKEAFAAAALEEDVRLVVAWTSGCPIGAVTVFSIGGDITDCSTFDDKSHELAAALRPDAIVLAQAATYENRLVSGSGGAVTDDAEEQRIFSDALADAVDKYREITPNVGVIEDNPQFGFDPIFCQTALIARDSCSESAAVVRARTSLVDGIIANTLQRLGVVNIFSVRSAICGVDECRTVDSDGQTIYRDNNHLSNAWTMTRVEEVRSFLKGLLG